MTPRLTEPGPQPHEPGGSTARRSSRSRPACRTWRPARVKSELLAAVAPSTDLGNGFTTLDGILGFCQAQSRRPQVIAGVDARAAAVDLVKLERLIDPPPQVVVLDGAHLAVALPLPAVLSPLGQPKANAARDIAAFRDECHFGGLIEGFQAAYQGHELQPLGRSWFLIGRFQPL